MGKITLLLVTATALITITGGAVHAGSGGKKQSKLDRYHPDNFFKVNTKATNCDALVGIAKKRDFVLASGQIVTADPFSCQKVSTDLTVDYYEARGAYVRAKGGFCNVWSCQGVRSSDNDR